MPGPYSTSLSAPGAVTHTLGPRDGLFLAQLTGTYAGVGLGVQATVDGTNYAPVTFLDRTAFARDPDGLLSALATGRVLEVDCGGFRAVRLDVTAVGSGTLTVTAYSSDPRHPAGGPV